MCYATDGTSETGTATITEHFQFSLYCFKDYCLFVFVFVIYVHVRRSIPSGYPFDIWNLVLC